METTLIKEESINDFIESVREQPHLWDTSNDDYKNLDLRRAAWTKLSEDFGYEGLN